MKQMAGYYLLAVVAIVGILAESIVRLELGRPEGYNTDATYKLLEICGGALATLLLLLKSAQNGKEITEVKNVVVPPPEDK